MAQVNEPKYNSVDVNHPRIQDFLKSCAQKGVTKDKAMKLAGMPAEVVDRAYQDVKK
jgi:hypothetical protein